MSSVEFETWHLKRFQLHYRPCNTHFAMVIRRITNWRKRQNDIPALLSETFKYPEDPFVNSDTGECMSGFSANIFDLVLNLWISIIEHKVGTEGFDIRVLLYSQSREDGASYLGGSRGNNGSTTRFSGKLYSMNAD